jgi:hypothetical protein
MYDIKKKEESWTWYIGVYSRWQCIETGEEQSSFLIVLLATGNYLAAIDLLDIDEMVI